MYLGGNGPHMTVMKLMQQFLCRYGLCTSLPCLRGLNVPLIYNNTHRAKEQDIDRNSLQSTAYIFIGSFHPSYEPGMHAGQSSH